MSSIQHCDVLFLDFTGCVICWDGVWFDSAGCVCDAEAIAFGGRNAQLDSSHQFQLVGFRNDIGHCTRVISISRRNYA